MELTELEKGYIAGIIDGEGSVVLTRFHANEHRSPAITVSSTTREILDFLKEKCGGTISTKKKYQEHHKDSWMWTLRRDKAIELLNQVQDYLLVPAKYQRAHLITSEYKKVTPRNGIYSEEKLRAKLDFEEHFMSIVD